MKSQCLLSSLFISAMTMVSTCVHAALPLETETARLLPRNAFEFEAAFEYQTSSEGKEMALPTALEYGLSDNLQLLIEPVFFTSIRPKDGRHATGMGDTEVTVDYLLLKETPRLPALAVAGEVKFPTAHDDLIGTGKTDYTPFLIASKRIGPFDFHLNLGYTIVGQPEGTDLQNTFNYALAGEYFIDSKWDLVAEVYGNTSSTGESSDGGDSQPAVENSVTPEASGGETVGMIGARYHVRDNISLSLGVSYDNNNALLVSPGFNLKF